jgi:hypothetical protein
MRQLLSSIHPGSEFLVRFGVIGRLKRQSILLFGVSGKQKFGIGIQKATIIPSFHFF